MSGLPMRTVSRIIQALSDILETEGVALEVPARLGFDASSGAKSSSDAKRAKGFEPSTSNLSSTTPRPA